MKRTDQDVALLVKRLQHRHHRALNAALAQLGVSLVQWDTLRHLARHPGASLHDLALLTFQTDQSFGSLATRMADRGLIERIAGPGRAVRHRLTPRGLELKKAGDALVDGVVGASLRPLSAPERDQLGDLLTKLLDETDQQAGAAPPEVEEM